MARIGLRYPVAAPITKETYGEAPTYGEGFYIGKAVSAEKSIESNNNPLYGDDAIAENDTSFSSGTLTIGVTDFGTVKDSTLAVQAKLLGHQVVMDGDVEILRKAVGDVAPYLGFGYVKTKKTNNETHFEATWLYKVQFQEPSESTNAKGKTIEWQTPTITGTIMMVEGMDGDTWEDTAIFDTIGQARAWLEAKACITSTVDKAALAEAIAAAEGEDPEGYTSASYVEMYVALLHAQSIYAASYVSQTDVNAAKTALETAVLELAERG